MVKAFAGILQADAYAGYNRLYRNMSATNKKTRSITHSDLLPWKACGISEDSRWLLAELSGLTRPAQERAQIDGEQWPPAKGSVKEEGPARAAPRPGYRAKFHFSRVGAK